MLKKIPYGRQKIDQKDIQSALNVLHSDFLTTGPQIALFENNICQYLGVSYAVAVSNGTTALHLAYLSAGIQNGDEVIITANTFVATSNMVLLCGAKPVFCDIRMDTYNIDQDKIEALITPQTKAIVAVHFAGQACEMTRIWQIARKYRLLVIEDGAHALGAKYLNQKIGAGQSAMTTFSFHPVKPVTTGEGGVIVTNNKKYYEKLLLLRTHGVQKDQYGFNVMIELGFNYRITDIQCALGSSQMKKIDDFISKRHQIAKWYQQDLSDVKEIIIPQEIEGNYSGWHLYVILVKNKKNRNKLAQYLIAQGILVNYHYPPVYSNPYYRKNGFQDNYCKNAEYYFNRCITLPLYVDLNRTDIKRIAQGIKSFLNK